MPIGLTSIGLATCRLGGYPLVYEVTAAGRRVAIAVGHGTYFGNLVATDLVRGATGYLLIAGNDLCLGLPTTSGPGAQAPGYHRLLVELPRGRGSFTVTVTRLLPCAPLDVSQFGAEAPLAVSPGPPPGTPAALHATLQLPSRIRGGQVLRYVVTLTNTGGQTVALVPCPGYSEAIALGGQAGRVLGRSYELNCESVGRLAPEKSARFEMEIPIPRVVQPTPAKLVWGIDVGSGELGGPEGVYYLAARQVTVCPPASACAPHE